MRFISFLIVLFSFAFSSCTSNDSQESEVKPNEQESKENNDQALKMIPSYGVGGDCVESHPSFDKYLSEADLIAFGTVSKVSQIKSPAIESPFAETDPASCSETIPALEITLSMLEVHNGRNHFDHEKSKSLTIKIDAFKMSDWASAPISIGNDPSDFRWTSSEVGIFPGQKLGFKLYWSDSNDSFIPVKSIFQDLNGRILWGETGECSSVPQDLKQESNLINLVSMFESLDLDSVESTIGESTRSRNIAARCIIHK